MKTVTGALQIARAKKEREEKGEEDEEEEEGDVAVFPMSRARCTVGLCVKLHHPRHCLGCVV